KLEECDRTRGTGGRRIYYLAVPPNFFPVISDFLGAEGMVTDPEKGGPYTRVIIEKPFGRDLASAKELNRVAVTTFRERQVFRIDHYLGKETVQNLLVLRFDTAGITRDIVQNHLLQLVSLVAMEPPVAFEADAIRDEKVKVIRALRTMP